MEREGEREREIDRKRERLEDAHTHTHEKTTCMGACVSTYSPLNSLPVEGVVWPSWISLRLD